MKEKHTCDRVPSIEIVKLDYEPDEIWSIETDEYSYMPIYFCPFCGIKLK